MKSFDAGGQEFYSIRAMRRWLRDHPEVLTVTREWWSRGDRIEVREMTRDQIFGRPASALTRGATAQWGQDHPGL